MSIADKSTEIATEAGTEHPGEATAQAEVAQIDLGSSELFTNRELGQLAFNRRVLDQALDEATPLLERVKFLAIFFNNLDEFFMVRVSGLRRQLSAGVVEAPPDGMTPAEQLAAVREQLLPMLEIADSTWHEDLLPKLRRRGVRVLEYDELKGKQRKLLRRHFKSEIFPVLTPLAYDPSHPFPHISNLSINLALVVRDATGGERFARLKVPQTLPRLLSIPDEDAAESYEFLGLSELRSSNFVWLEDVIRANVDLLFPGLEVISCHPFRVTRDADMELEEDEAADLLIAMAEVVGKRHFGSAVRLEVNAEMPSATLATLIQNLGVAPYQLYRSRSRIGLSNVMELAALDIPRLRDQPFQPRTPASLSTDETIFATLRRSRQMLLYHPYDSFSPVVRFLKEAADDPSVIAIKQTLYRVGADSPIVEALMAARENGKQVSVLVELKARFDETHNIGWARALEEAGVHVVYGVLGLKTHAKVCLVVRRESDGIHRYVHLSTGNYNPQTARIYTDLGYFTTDAAIGNDVTDLFNKLTGYSRKQTFRKLLVAPGTMRREILDRIDREIARQRAHGDGRIVFKMNALVDKRCIQALYRASQAGVEIDLLVRGICCLRPGVPGVSETITVTSIVGRFLEHARIYYFRNGGDEEMLLGSADLMPRNLDHRVELLFPIESEPLRRAIRDDILLVQLWDTGNTYRLASDGTYQKVEPPHGKQSMKTQESLLATSPTWYPEEFENRSGDT